MKLEARATGDIAMAWRARGNAERAAYWANECALRDYALPKPGVDQSWNYAPCLRAGRGDWNGLRESLAHYWRNGAGNEFNSPLYSARVYVAAILGALLGGGTEAWRFMHRWTAWLSLQAVAMGPLRHERIWWNGAPLRVKPRRVGATGIGIPCTGMRANSAAVGQPLVEPVLAHVLGIEHHLRGSPTDPPRDKQEWERRGNPRNPESLVQTVELAERQVGKQLAKQPWMMECRDAVRGDFHTWEVIAAAVRDEIVLPRGLKQFIIQRDRNRVLTAWEGISPTRQKPSIAAASIVNGHREALIVADWKIPSDQTESIICARHVRAQANGQSGSLPLLFGGRRLIIVGR